MALLDNVNIYQRVFLFAFIMIFLWWAVEILSYHKHGLSNFHCFLSFFACKISFWSQKMDFSKMMFRSP